MIPSSSWGLHPQGQKQKTIKDLAIDQLSRQKQKTANDSKSSAVNNN